MPDQFSLFDQPAEDLLADLRPTRSALPGGSGRRSIDERFLDFHRQNPHVYRGLRKLALQMKRAGHTRWSTKAAFEVLRWQWALATQSADGFKLSNDYTAPYARLLMQQEPELDGFFVTKERTSAGAGEFV